MFFAENATFKAMYRHVTNLQALHVPPYGASTVLYPLGDTQIYVEPVRKIILSFCVFEAHGGTVCAQFYGNCIRGPYNTDT